MYDYTDAQPQREIELIPAGTVATLQLTIRAGGAGEDGLLKRSKDGGCEMLDCEFIVVDGQFARRKFWQHLLLAGTTDGQTQMAETNRGKLRAILESARGIKTDDFSPQARTARKAKLVDFDGIRFIGKIGIEKGAGKSDGNGNYPDRNVLQFVITPDGKDWHAVEQTPPQSRDASSGGAAPAPAAIGKPKWAS